MRTLYQAAHAVEAHMLRDLLAQEGIATEIHGEHLPGAMGGLPAAGLVHLSVDEDAYDRARALIERWEAEQPRDRAPAAPARQRSNAWFWLAIGVLLGAGATLAYTRIFTPGAGADERGAHEERRSYALSGGLVRVEADRNRDGRVDRVSHYDADGALEATESDEDFNGSLETRKEYRNGILSSAQIDTDHDGVADTRLDYTPQGELERRERLAP